LAIASPAAGSGKSTEYRLVAIMGSVPEDGVFGFELWIAVLRFSLMVKRGHVFQQPQASKGAQHETL
jgi:hypothetical protein